MLRRQLQRERSNRKAAEAEAEIAREIAADARARVDALRLDAAERDLDEAISARRRSAGLSHDGHDKGAGGTRESILHHREPPRPPSAAAAPGRTRGHAILLRDLHTLEAALYNAVDGKAGADSDAARNEVLCRVFKSVNAHRDRFLNRAEFALGVGKFGLGLAARAGASDASTKHWGMREPKAPTLDVNYEILDAMFERYSEAAGWGGERLVDLDSLYARLKRYVKPEARATRSGVDKHAGSLERELADHPFHSQGHPYEHHGRYPSSPYRYPPTRPPSRSVNRR